MGGEAADGMTEKGEGGRVDDDMVLLEMVAHQETSSIKHANGAQDRDGAKVYCTS